MHAGSLPRGNMAASIQQEGWRCKKQRAARQTWSHSCCRHSEKATPIISARTIARNTQRHKLQFPHTSEMPSLSDGDPSGTSGFELPLQLVSSGSGGGVNSPFLQSLIAINAAFLHSVLQDFPQDVFFVLFSLCLAHLAASMVRFRFLFSRAPPSIPPLLC